MKRICLSASRCLYLNTLQGQPRTVQIFELFEIIGGSDWAGHDKFRAVLERSPANITQLLLYRRLS